MIAKEAIEAYVERIWPQVLDDIATLVAENSIEDLDQAAPGAPYGPGPARALEAALAIATRLGLAATNCDGSVGYADLAGTGSQVLATMAHADVVPCEGQPWATDPFELVRRDGWLIGRGVIDDKGPLVLALHAAGYFAQLDEAPRHTLRTIVGANEETGMVDAAWYVEHLGSPDFLFTPDADFPVCKGEKGLYQGHFVSKPLAGSVIVSFEGGTAPNAIAERAEVVVRRDAATLPAAERLTIEDAGEGQARIVAHGVGGHASLPEGTVNAIELICRYLLDQDICDEGTREFLELQMALFSDHYGEGLGIAATDEGFGRLTVVGGHVTTTPEGRFVQSVDSRYVTTITGDEITARLKALSASHGATYEPLSDEPPFYIDPDSPEIAALTAAFSDFSDAPSDPYTIGGGTYARHFARGVAFGPEMPIEDRPEWAGTMHSANEAVPEAHLKMALCIYIDAIGRLLDLDLG